MWAKIRVAVTKIGIIRELSQRRSVRLGVIFLLIITGLLAATLATLPPLLQPQLASQLSQALGAPTTVEKVSFNPFTQTLTLEEAVIHDAQQQPLLRLPHSQLQVAMWASLWERAPVVRALTLQKPQLFITRLSAQHYNFSAWLTAWLARPSSPTPPRFAIHNIKLQQGEIRFNDQVLQREHRLHALDFNLPFISTLPSGVDTWVQPHLAAQLDGKHLQLQALAQPFTPQQTARLRLQWDKLALAPYRDYLPAELGIHHLAGNWQGDVQLHFVRAKNGTAQLRLAINSALTNADIEHTLGHFSWERLAVKLPQWDISQRQLQVTEVTWQRPQLYLTHLPNQETKTSPTSHPAWRWQLDQLNIQNGAFTWQADRQRQIALVAIQLQARHWQNQRALQGELNLSAQTPRGGQWQQQGKVAFFPHTQSDGTVQIKDWPLAPYAPWLATAPVQPRQGTLTLASHYEIAQDQTVTWHLRDSELKLHNLQLRSASMAQWPLGHWEADIAHIDGQNQRIDVCAVRGEETGWPLLRTPQGEIQFQPLNGLTKSRHQAKNTSDSRANWHITIAKIDLSKQQIHFTDQAKNLNLALTPLTLRVGAIDSQYPTRPLAIQLHSGFGSQSGQLNLQGTLTPQTWQWHGLVNIQGLDIVPLQTYLAERLRFHLSRGLLDAQGQLHINPAGTSNRWPDFQGRIGLRKVNAVEQSSRDPLFSWSQLQLQPIQLRLKPSLALDIGRVSLDDFYSRLILRSEGRLNVQDLWVNPPSVATPSSPMSNAVSATAVSNTTTPARIRIGEISLQRGQVNFSDYFVKPNYNANLSSISGLVRGLSSTDNRLAEITLTALQDRHAPVGILGTINPFGRDLALDIEAKVRGIEMTPLSPYAVKYAGYGIEKGKMSFDVHYQVAERKLSAENRLMLDQLTFGEHVAQANAPNLPVKLAVALLKDRHGVIDINLPIGGSLDDPQFSLGGLVGKMFWNLLVKIATAPFSFLGSLFDGVADEPSQLSFEPGYARLSVANESQLNKLAEILRDKPSIHLEITGHISPEDKAGLQQARLKQQLLALKRATLRDEEASEDIFLRDDEYPSLLSRLYRKTSLPDKPRNLIGLAKEIPVNEMENRLLAHQIVTAEQLRTLAQQRADVIREYLINKGQLPPERIFILAEQMEGGHHAAFNLRE